MARGADGLQQPQRECDAAAGGAAGDSCLMHTCSVCHRVINWRQRWRFSSWIGQRAAAPCPHCGQTITWDKWPYRIMIIGQLLIILNIPLLLLDLHSDLLIPPSAKWIVLAIAVVFVIIGLVTLRFEQVNDNEGDVGK
jgi:hypothetical protein